jgi:hypothetical protein
MHSAACRLACRKARGGQADACVPRTLQQRQRNSKGQGGTERSGGAQHAARKRRVSGGELCAAPQRDGVLPQALAWHLYQVALPVDEQPARAACRVTRCGGTCSCVSLTAGVKQSTA